MRTNKRAQALMIRRSTPTSMRAGHVGSAAAMTDGLSEHEF